MTPVSGIEGSSYCENIYLIYKRGDKYKSCVAYHIKQSMLRS